jgi:opacity protein-like surface antigen
MMKSMKKFLCVCAALAMTLSAATAMAADVTGSWTADVKAPDGSSFQLTFTFKQDGTTLTGTVLGAGGDPIPITNGKVDGDKFTFDDSFNGITIHHDCTVTGDTIKVVTKTDSADFPGMELTLTRAKSVPGVPTGVSGTAVPLPQ